MKTGRKSLVDRSYTNKFTARMRMRYYKRTQEVSIQRSLFCSPMYPLTR